MAIIREDKHGLYVKTGGYIIRPLFPNGYNHAYEDGTEHSKGDKVRATHCTAGPIAKVGGEYWYIHGAYKGNPEFTSPNSEDSYKPKYDNWS